MEPFYFSKVYFIILILLIFGLMFYQYFLVMNILKYQSNNKQEQINIPSIYQEQLGDPVMSYDYNKLYNPLTDPTRRINRYEIPPYYFKGMIDFPTRGYPDSYSQLGVLVNKKKDQDNKILRLFGRQTYPGSNTYEYYIMVNSGLDNIKLPLNTRRRNELYDGDEVFVSELDKKYTVNLYKYDYPRYYPDLI